MGDELYRTVKIKLDREGASDKRGSDSGTSPAQETEFELVSTMMLKQILESDDDQKKDQIRELADEGDGVLACATGTDEFKILLDEELESALSTSPKSAMAELADLAGGTAIETLDETGEGEDFALVSTQLLRAMLPDADKPEAETTKADGAPKEEFKIGGFNPYDSS